MKMKKAYIILIIILVIFFLVMFFVFGLDNIKKNSYDKYQYMDYYSGFKL